MDDDEFPGYVADRLAALPSVQAVNLGGSRARATHRPDSDWDFAIYYRGHFDPQALRDIGWPGEVGEVGGWGGGVFNGGAWLEVDHRRVDVHYRDLDTIDRETAEASEGRFRIEPLMFHLAGIPSYLVLAELAGSQALRGRLPKPEYPRALRERAPRVWWDRAGRTFEYARVNHAPYGRLTQCAGLIAQAAAQAAHAVLAARGEWATNDKTLLTLAGLRQVDEFLAIREPDPILLRDAAERSRALCEEVLRAATGPIPESGLARPPAVIRRRSPAGPPGRPRPGRPRPGRHCPARCPAPTGRFPSGRPASQHRTPSRSGGPPFGG